MQIVNKDDVAEAARESDGYFIKSGIVTIIKDAVIPNGTIIWAGLVQKEKDKIIQNEHRYGSHVCFSGQVKVVLTPKFSVSFELSLVLFLVLPLCTWYQI